MDILKNLIMNFFYCEDFAQEKLLIFKDFTDILLILLVGIFLQGSALCISLKAV